jgi:hypothetical protein
MALSMPNTSRTATWVSGMSMASVGLVSARATLFMSRSG